MNKFFKEYVLQSALFWFIIISILAVIFSSNPPRRRVVPEDYLHPPEDEIADPTGRGWH